MTPSEAKAILYSMGVVHKKTLKLRDKFRVGLRADEFPDESLAEVERLVQVAYPNSLVQVWRGKDEIGRWDIK